MKYTPLALSLAALFALGAGTPSQAYAQSVAWDQANETWLTQSTDHFVIHFRNGHEKQAARALDLAEQSHKELVPYFGYEPKENRIGVGGRGGLFKRLGDGGALSTNSFDYESTR